MFKEILIRENRENNWPQNLFSVGLIAMIYSAFGLAFLN